LILLIVTGISVSGTNAIFSPPFSNDPLIPGPLIKKPKTSLNAEQVYSGYSSEAHMYLNLRTCLKIS